MKTDSIFYKLFKNLPSSFFELINQPSSLGDTYNFTSVEVKQAAFRIDGVFLPPENASYQPIYFSEVQFQLDKKFYQRFFGEIFLYLAQSELVNDWRGVIIFKKRSIDPGAKAQYRELLNSPRIIRIYLDELGETAYQSLGLGVVKLVVESKQKAPTSAKQLLAKAASEISDESLKKEIIQLIETIILYKFPKKSREEIEAMFGLSDLKKTKVYQEAKQEGKLESVPRLLALGLTVEQVAKALDLSVEQVNQEANNNKK